MSIIMIILQIIEKTVVIANGLVSLYIQYKKQKDH